MGRKHGSRLVRGVNLTALTLAGLLVGYLGVQLWRGNGEPAAAAPDTTTGLVPTSPAAPSASQGNRSDALPVSRSSRGSSLSVVGGLSPEELQRLGFKPVPAAVPEERSTDRRDQGFNAPPDTVPGAPAAGGPGARGSASSASLEGPPAAERFPSAVAQAARHFRCLCGCPHNLAVCPCNQQPVGAVTMLTYLEKLLDRQTDGDSGHDGMVDRYGERVVADSPVP